jgi:hypothetical protein
VRTAWADAAQVTPWAEFGRGGMNISTWLRCACQGCVRGPSSRCRIIFRYCEHERLLLPLQVPGQSAVRFFVASQGPVDPPAGGFTARPACQEWLAHHAVWSSPIRPCSAVCTLTLVLTARVGEPSSTHACSAAAELKTRSDFVWLDLPQQQNYRTIGDATLEVFQHVVASYDFSFVLKVGAASELQRGAAALVLQQRLGAR